MTDGIVSRGPDDISRTQQIANQASSRKPGIDNTPAKPEVKRETLSSDEARTAAVDTLAQVAAEIDQAMNILNETLSVGPTSVSISKDNDLNKFLVTIFDDESGEIIREIPNEAMQRFARNLKEIQGLIFDEHG